ncbi:hypothetical protein Lepto7376_2542 [[Leptolyngbya] sp. PCC 7376]|uniref:COP23 domain-containing protein n=1 Tax=[Leptolyngbya] sp. PCC 7376 TaxID=111781 RepID=UPI00029F1342|nr:COP23 domain-containing protein [[Leptolyngbya] sp. PCC 7376]AFY38816.1 hypothetical protein Lepto7376_2542 [[Leptolyngbya] sp. PCC 7376]
MRQGSSRHHNFLKISIVALEILGFAAVSAIAQTPPDVVIESEPEASGQPGTVVTDGDQRFVCENSGGQYTVMYRPESQPGENYAWAVPQSMGGGWTAQRRCVEISRRLESYRSDGLVELTTGRENNYDVVCVTTEANNSCQIVFTVPQGQNAIATRDAVFDNLATADDGVQTQGVNTFGSRQNNNDVLGQIFGIFGGNSQPISSPSKSSGINLKPFLDPSDGGTGSALVKGSISPHGFPNSPSSSPSRQLNPDLFR